MRIKTKTLVEAFEAQLDSPNGITYIENAGKQVNLAHKELYNHALGLLHCLQARGIGPGREIILLLNHNKAFIDVFWAALFGNMIPVPLAPGISDEHRSKVFNVFNLLKNPWLFTDKKNLDRLEKFARRSNLQEGFEKLKRRSICIEDINNLNEKGKIYYASPEDIAFIQFSSGSTGAPRGVTLTHNNLITNINAMVKRIDMNPGDYMLSWMPLTHDMGLIGFHIALILNGVAHAIMPTELFIRRPLVWLQKTTELRANVLCSPNFGYKHYLNALPKQPGSPQIDLSHVRLLFNGAEPISVSLCDDFLSRMGKYGLKRNAMYPVYGLAEAGLAVTMPSVNRPYEVVHVVRETLVSGNGKVQLSETAGNETVSFVKVGKVVDDCQLRISNGNGLPTENEMVGRIEIKGKNVTAGYYQKKAASEGLISADGWLDTGDLGFMIEDNLVITGRAKDIIFFNGQNYYPQDIENLILRNGISGIGKLAVAGVRNPSGEQDEVMVFILHKGKAADLVPAISKIKHLVNSAFGIIVSQVIPLGQIPKTTSGKIQRFRLAEAYKNGEYAEVIQDIYNHLLVFEKKEGAESVLEKKLQIICNDVLEGIEIDPGDNIFELGTSSLSLAQIHERIEEIWPGMLEVTDFFDYPTIRELAGFMGAKMEGKKALT